MIRLICGENEFLKGERLSELIAGFGAQPERFDGEEMTTGQLRELAQGQTLFDESRLVVISDLSLSPAWTEAPEVLDGASTEIILLEQKVDKRTKTYKWLKKSATVEEFVPFGEREGAKVAAWAIDRAKKRHGFRLSSVLASRIVERIGHDQMRIDRLLEQLALVDEVNEGLIDAMVPLPKMENVFELFEAALRGQHQKIHDIIGYLELESGVDGAYQTLGLVVSQLVPLSALVLGGNNAEVAKDFSVHPFVVQKLTPYARNLTVEQIAKINQALGQADMSMKTTSVSPWLILETALVEVGEITK